MTPEEINRILAEKVMGEVTMISEERLKWLRGLYVRNTEGMDEDDEDVEILRIIEEFLELRQQKQALIEDGEFLHEFLSEFYGYVAGVQFHRDGTTCKECRAAMEHHQKLMRQVKGE